MTEEQLKRANQLKEDIRELGFFLDFSKRSPWKRKFKFQLYKFSLIRRGWTPIESDEFKLDEQTQSEVVEILYRRLEEMKQELQNM